MNATDYAAALTSNVSDWYAGAITHEAFSARAGALWAEIECVGLRSEVLAIWRAS